MELATIIKGMESLNSKQLQSVESYAKGLIDKFHNTGYHQDDNDLKVVDEKEIGDPRNGHYKVKIMKINRKKAHCSISTILSRGSRPSTKSYTEGMLLIVPLTLLKDTKKVYHHQH